MLKIRSCSDLHLEFFYDTFDGDRMLAASKKLEEILPPLPTDAETVLIAAGDIATAKRSRRFDTFFQLAAPRFRHIIYVLGNHEHYGTHLDESQMFIEDAASRALGENYADKLTIAGNEPVMVQIDGVIFILGTLWTDYGWKVAAGDHYALSQIHQAVARCITDHKVILDEEGRGVTPTQMHQIFKATIEQFGKWMTGIDNSRTVVVTHHLPSMQAVHPMYMLDPTTRILNHAFASDLDDFILQHQPAMWFFGHTHTKFSGKIGETLLHCNPLGYPHERGRGETYDTTQVFEV